MAGKKAVTQRRGEKGQQVVSFESSTPTSSLSTSFQGAVKSPLGLAISPILAIPAETHASCHFMSNFVLVPRQSTTSGFLDYLEPLLKSPEGGNSHMMHAFNACALASMGNRVKAYEADFCTRAHDEYIKAIQVTNIALRHPDASKSDATLAAVLLMGMYEVSHPRVGEREREKERANAGVRTSRLASLPSLRGDHTSKVLSK